MPRGISEEEKTFGQCPKMPSKKDGPMLTEIEKLRKGNSEHFGFKESTQEQESMDSHILNLWENLRQQKFKSIEKYLQTWP